jgi:hypothetical protein
MIDLYKTMKILPTDGEFLKGMKRIYNKNLQLMTALAEEDKDYIGREDLRG